MQKWPGGAKVAHKIGVFCIRWVIAEKNAKDGYQTRWQIFRKRRISVQDIGCLFIYKKKMKNRLFYLLDYKVTVVQTF